MIAAVSSMQARRAALRRAYAVILSWPRMVEAASSEPAGVVIVSADPPDPAGTRAITPDAVRPNGDTPDGQLETDMLGGEPGTQDEAVA